MTFFGFLGTSTDGEFEQLRRRGETRSLHIWQLAHDSHDSVSKMSKRTLLQMLEMQGGIETLSKANKSCVVEWYSVVWHGWFVLVWC